MLKGFYHLSCVLYLRKYILILFKRCSIDRKYVKILVGKLSIKIQIQLWEITMEKNNNEIIEESTLEAQVAEKEDTATAMSEKETEQNTETAENTETVEKEDGRYRIIARLEENLWTYGSPIIFESGVLERDQISQKNRLTLKFTNIYEKTIRDVYISIFIEDGTAEPEVMEHSYVALGQKYLVSKGTAAKIPVRNEEALDFKIKIERVVFEDGSLWMKKNAMLESAGAMDDVEAFAEAKLKDYEDNYISAIEEVEKDDSVSINSGMEILKRITWYKDSLEILKDAKRKYIVAKQNEERKQASEDRRINRQKAVKKRYITAGVITGIVALLAVISVVAFFIPNDKYKNAQKLLENGEIAKAADSFKDLKGFRNSEDYLAQAYYNMGLNALTSGDEAKASEYFTQSNDADKDSKYGQMAGAFLNYYAGEEAFNNKEYDKALDLFKASADMASDFNLINKASAGMAQISYVKGEYEAAWNTIKNVYAKDASYEAQYGEFGYGYAKHLVDKGEIKKGMEIYNSVSKFTKSDNLNEGVYNQAVKLGEEGKIAEAMDLLKQIKGGYSKANKLYENMHEFDKTVKSWLGTWRHTGKVQGEKKTFIIRISEVLYKGEMCLRIEDKNNDVLGFDTIISSKNRVTQIEITDYRIHFKLKKYHDQKFTYTLLEGNKMKREQKYAGNKYTTKYKKVSKKK